MKKKWGVFRDNNFRYFEENLPSLRDKILVDLGSGDRPFKTILNRAGKCINVDFGDFPETTLVADLTKYPIPLDASIADIVFLSNTLEHIPTPQLLISEAYRILKPDGIIIGTVPFFRGVHQAPYDFLRYTSHMLEKILMDAGFGKIEITPLGTPFEVFSTTELTFFDKLMDHTGGNIKIRFARKCFFLMTKLFKPTVDVCPPIRDFAEGYGFKAYKNSVIRS